MLNQHIVVIPYDGRALRSRKLTRPVFWSDPYSVHKLPPVDLWRFWDGSAAPLGSLRRYFQIAMQSSSTCARWRSKAA